MSGKERLSMDEINRKLRSIRFFPGSKQEYEEMVGYKVKIIDTGDSDFGVLVYCDRYHNSIDAFETQERKEKLVMLGIEALVNGKKVENNKSYGLPVAKNEAYVERVR